MRYLLIILFFTSCMTEKKATDYLNTHPLVSARYCMNRYPVVSTIIVKTDTITVEANVTELMLYADSMAQIANERNRTAANTQKIADQAIMDKEFTEQKFMQLRDSISKYKYIDVPALTKSIEAKLRATLKPCKDSLIYQEPPGAIEYRAQIEADNKALQKENQELKDQMSGKALIPWYWFLILALVIAAVIWLRGKTSAITSILSKFKS